MFIVQRAHWSSYALYAGTRVAAVDEVMAEILPIELSKCRVF